MLQTAVPHDPSDLEIKLSLELIELQLEMDRETAGFVSADSAPPASDRAVDHTEAEVGQIASIPPHVMPTSPAHVVECPGRLRRRRRGLTMPLARQTPVLSKRATKRLAKIERRRLLKRGVAVPRGSPQDGPALPG